MNKNRGGKTAQIVKRVVFKYLIVNNFELEKIDPFLIQFHYLNTFLKTNSVL